MKLLQKLSTHYLIVLACLYFGFVVGATNLKSDPIKSFSEWNSIRHLNFNIGEPANKFAEILESVTTYSYEHGPLYFVVLGLWRALTGQDLFTYRLLSVFFGLLGVAFAYRLASITRDRDTALYAVVFTAFLSFFLVFTYEVRMYSLLPLLTAFVVWVYWSVVSAAEGVKWWQWLLLTLGSASIIYVHYFGIIPLAAIGVYHILFVRKDGRWLGICMAMIFAGLLFTPWLPVFKQALGFRHATEGDRLTLFQAISAVVEVYSNGFSVFVLLFIAAVIRPFRQLSKSQKYILFVFTLCFMLMVLGNEFVPLLIARRLRYVVVMSVPLTCFYAIALRQMPGGRLIRLALLIAWIAAFFLFNSSDALSLYTNRKTQLYDDVPHFEDFVYQGDFTPRPGETIVSFHADVQLDIRVDHYYSVILTNWSDIVHLTQGAQGELVIQSRRPGDLTTEYIAANYIGVWVIHNPQKTDLQAMEIYSGWFRQQFQPCKRYFETDDNVIEYYVRASLPCDLLIDDDPFAINYDNGTQIENVVYGRDSNELNLYFWWQRTVYDEYARTVQVFDQHGNKVLSADKLVCCDGPDIQSIDIASLQAGDYVVHLILYDSDSMKSQPGMIVNGAKHFDRAVELVNFTISG